MADAFSFKIVKELGVISTGKADWAMKLTLVSWGDREPKYDIRSWSPDQLKMGKGITMTDDELRSLKKLLNSIDL